MDAGHVAMLHTAGAQRAAPPKSLREAASEFAALFMQKLLAQAWNADGHLSGGRETQAIYDQLTWEYARTIARDNGFGITETVVRALERPSREAARPAPEPAAGQGAL